MMDLSPLPAWSSGSRRDALAAHARDEPRHLRNSHRPSRAGRARLGAHLRSRRSHSAHSGLAGPATQITLTVAASTIVALMILGAIAHRPAAPESSNPPSASHSGAHWPWPSPPAWD